MISGLGKCIGNKFDALVKTHAAIAAMAGGS